MTVLYILVFIAAFLAMEFIAWFTHKYVMHGFLWSWHKSHHRPHDHTLEKNDLFAIVFSIPSILLILVGVASPNGYLLSAGIGVAAYGAFYVLFHDIIVHRRVKIKFRSKSRYLQRIINAHYVHHKTHTREGAEAFGFLYASKKYEKEKK